MSKLLPNYNPRITCDLLATSILLLSIWTVGCGARDEPLREHGLAAAREQNAVVASPAMRAFFSSRVNSLLPLPADVRGKNTAAEDPPIWDLSIGAQAGLGAAAGGAVDGRDRGRPRRPIVLTVGIVCGVAGIVMVGGAWWAYMVHTRRPAQDKMGAGIVGLAKM